MTGSPDRLLSPAEVAEWLQIPTKTLYTWRSAGRGPIGRRVGKHIRYARKDVERWLDQQADPGRPAA